MRLFADLPSVKETVAILVFLAAWMTETAVFMSFRPEHIFLCILILALFFASRFTRKLIVALMPFALFGISYDLMRIVPNYEVNPIDVRNIYEAEKSLFGITAAEGTLTPNEFFQLHNCSAMDFMAGVFYLCWVPVPMAFGIWLFFNQQRKVYLHFSIVFLLVNIIGFIGYYIYPAAPPWYAMKYGFEPILNTAGDVAGLVRFEEITGWQVFQGIYGRNANVFAAVPSLHSAYMVVALFYSLKARCSNIARIVFAVIMCGIWLTAVYTAHHYVIDVLLGIACALIGIALFEKAVMQLQPVKRFMDSYTKYIS